LRLSRSLDVHVYSVFSWSFQNIEGQKWALPMAGSCWNFYWWCSCHCFNFLPTFSTFYQETPEIKNFFLRAQKRRPSPSAGKYFNSICNLLLIKLAAISDRCQAMFTHWVEFPSYGNELYNFCLNTNYFKICGFKTKSTYFYLPKTSVTHNKNKITALLTPFKDFCHNHKIISMLNADY